MCPDQITGLLPSGLQASKCKHRRTLPEEGLGELLCGRALQETGRPHKAPRWPQGAEGPQQLFPAPLPKAGEEGLVPWLLLAPPPTPLRSKPHGTSVLWERRIFTWGWGSQGKVGGMWGTAETRLHWSTRSIAPYSPGAGRGGAVSLRAFWLLGADGQAGRGSLVLVWLCTKEGPAGEGAAAAGGRVGALPLPLLTPARMPLGRFAH